MKLGAGVHYLRLYLQSKRSKTFEFQCQFNKDQVLIVYQEHIVPTIISTDVYGSILVQSNYPSPIDDFDLKVLQSNLPEDISISMEIINKEEEEEVDHDVKEKPSRNVAYPGQLFPIYFNITFGEIPSSDVYLRAVVYSAKAKIAEPFVLHLKKYLVPSSSLSSSLPQASEFIRVTFLDFDNSISYYDARPPLEDCINCHTIVLLSSKFTNSSHVISEYSKLFENHWVILLII